MMICRQAWDAERVLAVVAISSAHIAKPEVNNNNYNLHLSPNRDILCPNQYVLAYQELDHMTLSPTTSASEVAVSSLLAGRTVPHLAPTTDCGLIQLAPQDGVDVLLWKGQLLQPITMNLRDDWNRIHFSCAIRGRSSFLVKRQGKEIERVMGPDTSCISYTPDCIGRSSYAGSFEYVTVSVRPDLLVDWLPELGGPLKRELDSAQCCTMQRCSPEMRATAHLLSRTLRMASADHHGSPPSPLWLLGQALVLTSLAVEAHDESNPPSSNIGMADRQRLLRARDLLLADLSNAPTIAALARESGLGVVKLKRGFRLLFKHSVYGLFQQARMHEAHRRLSSGDTPVTVVAADLGYTNPSHFAAAFHKQFGVNPSAFKRRH